MRNLYIGFLLSVFFTNTLIAQQAFTFNGYVIHKATKQPLENVVVKIKNKQYTLTNSKGYFALENIPIGRYKLQTILMGHKDYFKEINLNKNLTITIEMQDEVNSLNEIVVEAKTQKRLAKELSVIATEISEDYLIQNRESSLMQTLEKLSGVSTITIGSGQSKPVIRGLGFNRVSVIQNGIKHEAQQWGSDHGLEIDQYGIKNIQVIKGPASLMYGSDAIAGVINLKQDNIPSPNTFSGELNLLTETNNDLYGVSAGIESRKNNWYFKGRLTYRDYADYKVPTNTINYDNYIFELYDNNLRNTTGREANVSFTIGYVSEKFKTETFISNVYGKNGFFANAHGMEVRLSDIDYDSSSRDIDLPYHNLNHIKIINNSVFSFDKHQLKIDIGFQNNLREEHSEPAAHGYMPIPYDTKEREFNKNTYTLNVIDEFKLDKHKISIGANAEYQNNKIGGWGFLIPEYRRFTTGFFAYDKYKLKTDLFLQTGVRYDYGVVNTSEYIDWFQSEVDNEDGTTSTLYLQRAKNDTYHFNSVSASVGLSSIKNKMTYKVNVGKSFRIPLANELASDGVNYHMFRYEVGNAELDAESSYQLDSEVSFENKNTSISITPFVNYFTNYIYLNPTSSYYETIQIYEYTQTEVFRFGGEINVSVKPIENLQLDGSLEYVYSRQKTGPKKNFTLPFSPPLSTLFSATYSFKNVGFIKNPQFKAEFRVKAKQDEIVPPEEVTKGYNTLGLSFLSQINLFKSNKPAGLRIKLNNVFNTKYYDHTSYYRLIDVPEAGRNLSLSLTVPF